MKSSHKSLTSSPSSLNQNPYFLSFYLSTLLYFNCKAQILFLICNISQMSEAQSDQQHASNKSTSSKENSMPKKKENKKGSKTPAHAKKEEKKSKPKKAANIEKQIKKEPKKKKDTKGKAEGDDGGILFVKQYMQKQNRPYNLLNVFDNLHGKIKKPALEMYLNELVEDKSLSCKQFGKNKVYYMNQDRLNVSNEIVDQMNSKYSELRVQETELNEVHKKITDQYKKLIAKKTLPEIEEKIGELKISIICLQKKKNRLMNEVSEKIDENIVIGIEKEKLKLEKQLSKRRKLTKECLLIWTQILEKKIDDVAEIMGIEL